MPSPGAGCCYGARPRPSQSWKAYPPAAVCIDTALFLLAALVDRHPSSPDGYLQCHVRPLKALSRKTDRPDRREALLHIRCFGMGSRHHSQSAMATGNSNTDLPCRPVNSPSDSLLFCRRRKARVSCCRVLAPRFAQAPSSTCRKQRALARSPSKESGPVLNRAVIDPSSSDIHPPFVWRVFIVMAARLPLFQGIVSSVSSDAYDVIICYVNT